MKDTKVFVTGDLRLGDPTAIKELGRPFDNVWDMDYAIISNWNKVVTDKDFVLVMGRFFGSPEIPVWEYLSCLNYHTLAYQSNEKDDDLFEKASILKNEKYYYFGKKMLLPKELLDGEKYYSITRYSQNATDSLLYRGKNYSFIFPNSLGSVAYYEKCDYNFIRNRYSQDRVVFSNFGFPSTAELPERLCNINTDRNNFTPVWTQELI